MGWGERETGGSCCLFSFSSLKYYGRVLDVGWRRAVKREIVSVLLAENDCGIFHESLGNHDALVLRGWQEAEVRIDPVDRDRRSYQVFFSLLIP